ncbi:MAG: hypothetical protein ASARMPRED_006525 [Alectoria sarmentosa]|nr:MAG: hypothetical protein ASARMPRED_006525 [Alectoria sarmentosa]
MQQYPLECSSLHVLTGNFKRYRKDPILGASDLCQESAGVCLRTQSITAKRCCSCISYTLTYTPSLDRILPSPTHLHVKIKNSSAIPLRAAYLHGPYTLYTACYPATFDPNYKYEKPSQESCPEFEPNLKAGGSWTSRLTVPGNIRETAGNSNVKRGTDGSIPSFTWIIEISSQVIFSTSASVNFELLVGRDEKSVELGFSSLTGQAVATPGQLQDHQQSKRSKTGHSAAQPKGVFSHAVTLIVDDTESLWNKPALPEWDDEGKDRGKRRSYPDPGEGNDFSSRNAAGEAGASNESKEKEPKTKKRKRVHLVVLTHGLHSNLGADMLYLKESIDAAAKEARQSARERRAKESSKHMSISFDGKARSKDESASPKKDQPDSSTAPLSGGQDDLDPGAAIDEEDEEEVIVRGFDRNATRTERGIQYLGKRLAKWVLSMTYPDQPYLPVKKSLPRKLSRVFTGDQKSDFQQSPAQHTHSSIHRPAKKPNDLAYKITSISFISHSLGGLTQTYAIAYIHKHSPNFFNEIKPINFVAMAAPFLGLSNENPLYVRFALDFGLVGRTGQDLGLTWRAPTMVRSGWGAMIGGIGSEGQRAHKQPDPGSKPLLRILPTGHTHQVLKLFRNRTVYSNVVNDGIVPLRTSCLLFLDWSGLDRVEKARRDNGLIGTMAGWGWSEITGANKSSNRHLRTEIGNDAWSQSESQSDMSGDEESSQGGNAAVPQPEENAVRDDTTAEGNEIRKSKQSPGSQGKPFEDEEYEAQKVKESSPQRPAHPLAGFLSFLRPNQSKSHHHSPKHTKIYKRSQTTNRNTDDVASVSSGGSSAVGASPGRVRGDSIIEDPENSFAPPKTTIFEAAGDVLNPPLPTREFLTNPQGRPRTIFHDRVYHPEDIPPPPTKKKREGLKRSFSSEFRSGPSRVNTDYDSQFKETPDTSSMKVEEKIARAYHHGLSWRKVLVRLEPDAHNNMVVRRMFANAYGWPVIKHLVDTHFADTYAAVTADVDEPNKERAKPPTEAVGQHGEEVRADTPREMKRSDSERYEAKDSISELTNMEDHSMNSSINRPNISRQDSAQWDDSMFDVTDDDDELDEPGNTGHGYFFSKADSPKGTSDAEIAEFLTRSPPPIDENVKAKSPNRAPSGGTSSVGLGKSVEERLSPGKSGRRTTDGQGEGQSGNLEDEVTRIRIGDGQ